MEAGREGKHGSREGGDGGTEGFRAGQRWRESEGCGGKKQGCLLGGKVIISRGWGGGRSPAEPGTCSINTHTHTHTHTHTLEGPFF